LKFELNIIISSNTLHKAACIQFRAVHCARPVLPNSQEQGRNDGGARGAQFPGRRITAGGVEKYQQCHKYFLQYSTFASEKPQVRIWGAKLAACPGRLI